MPMNDLLLLGRAVCSAANVMENIADYHKANGRTHTTCEPKEVIEADIRQWRDDFSVLEPAVCLLCCAQELLDHPVPGALPPADVVKAWLAAYDCVMEGGQDAEEATPHTP
jgi:hypothetical protein